MISLILFALSLVFTVLCVFVLLKKIKLLSFNIELLSRQFDKLLEVKHE